MILYGIQAIGANGLIRFDLTQTTGIPMFTGENGGSTGMRRIQALCLAGALAWGCDLSRSTAPEPHGRDPASTRLATEAPFLWSARAHYDAEGLVIEIDAKLDSTMYYERRCELCPMSWDPNDSKRDWWTVNCQIDLDLEDGWERRLAPANIHNKFGVRDVVHGVWAGYGRLSFRQGRGVDLFIPYQALGNDRDGARLLVSLCLYGHTDGPACNDLELYVYGQADLRVLGYEQFPASSQVLTRK